METTKFTKLQKTIGALWLNTTRDDKVYYKGNLEINGRKYFLTIFDNKEKTNSKRPDLKIILNGIQDNYPEIKVDLPEVDLVEEETSLEWEDQ